MAELLGAPQGLWEVVGYGVSPACWGLSWRRCAWEASEGSSIPGLRLFFWLQEVNLRRLIRLTGAGDWRAAGFRNVGCSWVFA